MIQKVPVGPTLSNRRSLSGGNKLVRSVDKSNKVIKSSDEIDNENPFNSYDFPNVQKNGIQLDSYSQYLMNSAKNMRNNQEESNAIVSPNLNCTTENFEKHISNDLLPAVDGETESKDYAGLELNIRPASQKGKINEIISERDTALVKVRSLEVKIVEIRHQLNEMTEAMENQEIIFRKKLKNRRAKFDRKIVRNRLLVKDRNDLLEDWVSAMKKSGQALEPQVKKLIERSQGMISEFVNVRARDKEENEYDDDEVKDRSTDGANDKNMRAATPITTSGQAGVPSLTLNNQRNRSSSPLRLGADGKPVLAQFSPRMLKYFEDKKAEERQKAAEAAHKERVGQKYEIFDPVKNERLVYDFRGKLVPEVKYTAPEVKAARRKKIQDRSRQAALGFGSATERILSSDVSDDDDASPNIADAMSSLMYTTANSSERAKVYVTMSADGVPHYAMSPRRYKAYQEEQEKAEAEDKRRQRIRQHFDIFNSEGKKLVYSHDGQLVTEEQFLLHSQTLAASSPSRASSRRSNRPDTADSQSGKKAPEDKYHFRKISLSPGENKGYHGGYDPAMRRTLRPAPPGVVADTINLTWSADGEDVAVATASQSSEF